MHARTHARTHAHTHTHTHTNTHTGIYVLSQILIHLFQDEWCTTLNMHKLYTERPAAKFLKLNMIPSPFIPELRSCVKVEVAVLGSPSLIFCTVSEDVKRHMNLLSVRAQELCESRGSRPEPSIHNCMYGLCGHEAIAQWLERRTRDWKVAGSNLCRGGGRIFFSRVDFLCWLLLRYPFHPRVTAVARKKDPDHSAKSAGGRLQLNTHTLTYVALHEVTWCMVVWCTQKLGRTWNTVSTPLRWILKRKKRRKKAL